MRSKLNAPSWGLKAAAAGALVFLNFPILIIALYAFTTDEATFSFPPPGLTLHWFGAAWERLAGGCPSLFDCETELWKALALSFQVAASATAAALALGSLTALAVHRTKFFGREAISFLVILPIALPGIVTGIALRSAMSLTDVPFSYFTIVVGHATFCIVTVYNNVIARLRRTGYSQIEASMDLGANTFQTFRYILLPTIGTALLAGGMLAFALSFDEVIVTTFTSGQQATLPIWIFSQLTKPRDRPVTNVVALFVVALTAIPILLAHRLTTRDSFN